VVEKCLHLAHAHHLARCLLLYIPLLERRVLVSVTGACQHVAVRRVLFAEMDLELQQVVGTQTMQDLL